MDIPRNIDPRKRRRVRIAYGVLGVVAVLLTSVGIARLKPAPPEVDRAAVWVDSVKRGAMDLRVRGLGTLVPEEIRWIPASTQGRVERRLVLPGTAVKADTVLIELSNPELVQGALDAEWQLKASEADYRSLRVRLESQLLDQKAAAATVQADFRQAKLQSEVDEKLTASGLASTLKSELSKVKAEELQTRQGIEQKRLSINSEAVQAQLDAQQAKIEQLRALYELKRSQLDSLHVRAGIRGVLQELPVEVGQQVTPGTTLAKVAEPAHLKAQLKIPETQAKDIQLGQSAEIDTHNGVIPGHVIRIDPAVQNGTVTVDVAVDGVLPKGARPDLSVDGTIEIEHLNDVLYIGRPAFGQANSTVSLFKLVDGAKYAVRVPVKLGRVSVNTVEILGGLKLGDEVILSDMSRWDGFDRIRLQ